MVRKFATWVDGTKIVAFFWQCSAAAGHKLKKFPASLLHGLSTPEPTLPGVFLASHVLTPAASEVPRRRFDGQRLWTTTARHIQQITEAQLTSTHVTAHILIGEDFHRAMVATAPGEKLLIPHSLCRI